MSFRIVGCANIFIVLLISLIPCISQASACKEDIEKTRRLEMLYARAREKKRQEQAHKQKNIQGQSKLAAIQKQARRVGQSLTNKLRGKKTNEERKEDEEIKQEQGAAHQEERQLRMLRGMLVRLPKPLLQSSIRPFVIGCSDETKIFDEGVTGLVPRVICDNYVSSEIIHLCCCSYEAMLRDVEGNVLYIHFVPLKIERLEDDVPFSEYQGWKKASVSADCKNRVVIEQKEKECRFVFPNCERGAIVEGNDGAILTVNRVVRNATDDAQPAVKYRTEVWFPKRKMFSENVINQEYHNELQAWGQDMLVRAQKTLGFPSEFRERLQILVEALESIDHNAPQLLSHQFGLESVVRDGMASQAATAEGWRLVSHAIDNPAFPRTTVERMLEVIDQLEKCTVKKDREKYGEDLKKLFEEGVQAAESARDFFYSQGGLGI